ncbi:MAG: MarR family EPS-associated transcriptional regulator [Gammaproteobacteria bacterium]|nr:MarR family EPS-associated transcriptional regulator [Gammaproteobacteria bacterium]|tara:strand:+ start:8648 stop:8998 length:351 start_codon:yes stop_codon:yes gene_type:complete
MTDNNKNNDKDLEVLRYLENQEKISQRELSANLGISLGKVNFILKALVEKGNVKARNFINNKNKRAYAYYLTPKGIEEKTRLTINFFKRKMQEYDDIKKELKQLEDEINKNKKENE